MISSSILILSSGWTRGTVDIEINPLIPEVPMLSSRTVASVNETSIDSSAPVPADGPQNCLLRHLVAPHEQD